MIPVTKPFFPPIEKYNAFLEGIWAREWFTNNGPLVKELEANLRDYLQVKHLAYLTNGTVALQLAIKALGLEGEIITTPFSYIATTSSILWEGCAPVFCDIDEDTLNINPALIENRITPLTSAILATHVYGNPCDVEAIDKIAKRHNLKVIYDAAHAFGVSINGRSLFNYGDVSTASFHATKIFHTIEGGAVITPDEKLIKRMEYMRNFGHDGPFNFAEVGINGKNSEVHAAMGLAVLPYMNEILDIRQKQFQYYMEKLRNANVKFQEILKGTVYNYSYFPVIFINENVLLQVEQALLSAGISPRRYFYPSLDSLRFFNNNHAIVPVCTGISKRVLCLPLYHSLAGSDIDRICNIVREHAG